MKRHELGLTQQERDARDQERRLINIVRALLVIGIAGVVLVNILVPVP